MMVSKSKLVLVTGLAFLLSMNDALAAETPSTTNQIDQRSFQLGTLSAFAEMVGVGLKTLALSSTNSPEEMESFAVDAKPIAQQFDVKLYREDDLIVTDLFPANVAEGKEVLLIYKGSTLDEYLALKTQKAELVAAGQYSGAAREQIARGFGKLLSYPDAKISLLIEQNAGQ